MLFVEYKQAQRGRAESGGAQTPRSSSCVMRVPLVTLVTLLSISESALPNSQAGHAPRAPAKARVEPKSPRQKHPNAPGGLRRRASLWREKKKKKKTPYKHHGHSKMPAEPGGWWWEPLAVHRKVINETEDIWSTRIYPTASEDPPKQWNIVPAFFFFFFFLYSFIPFLVLLPLLLQNNIKAWGDLRLDKAGESFHDTWWAAEGRNLEGCLRGEWIRRRGDAVGTSGHLDSNYTTCLCFFVVVVFLFLL